MASLVNYVREQPFVRYMRGQPLQAPNTQTSNTPRAQDAAPAQQAAAPNAHIENIEKTWVAKAARQTASVSGWMSAIRLLSNNTPLLGIPEGGAARAIDALAVFRKPTGLSAFAVKDIVCKQLEGTTMQATYATRLARWSARGAASMWYVMAEGLSQSDVRAWRSRPDYEYPTDCDPHDLSPEPNPHCPVLAVGQLAEKLEPVMGAMLIGAAGLGVAYGLYKFDLWRHKRPAPDLEAGGVQEPLLGEDAAAAPQEEHAQASGDAPAQASEAAEPVGTGANADPAPAAANQPVNGAADPAPRPSTQTAAPQAPAPRAASASASSAADAEGAATSPPGRNVQPVNIERSQRA